MATVVMISIYLQSFYFHSLGHFLFKQLLSITPNARYWVLEQRREKIGAKLLRCLPR